MTTSLVKELRRISEMDSLSYKDVFDSLDRINEKPSVGAEGLDKTSDAGANEGGAKNDSILSNAPNSYKNTGAFVSNSSKNRTYFCMLPHLLSNIGLTCFQRSVYWAIKESSGEDGVCTKSNESLAKMAGLSKSTLIRTIKELCEKNSLLGISLIKVKERYTDCGNQSTNEIHVTNLWSENEKWKKNEVRGGVSVGHGGVSVGHGGEGVCGTWEGVPQTHNEEPLNKNPKKETYEEKRKIVRSSPSKKEEKKHSKILSEVQEKSFRVAWQYLEEKKMTFENTEMKSDGSVPKGVTESDLKNWILSRDFHELRETIFSVKKENVTESFPAYIQSLLNINLAKKSWRAQKQKNETEKLIRELGVTHIKINKKYFTNTITGEMVYFDLVEHSYSECLFEAIKCKENNEI